MQETGQTRASDGAKRNWEPLKGRAFMPGLLRRPSIGPWRDGRPSIAASVTGVRKSEAKTDCWGVGQALRERCLRACLERPLAQLLAFFCSRCDRGFLTFLRPKIYLCLTDPPSLMNLETSPRFRLRLPCQTPLRASRCPLAPRLPRRAQLSAIRSFLLSRRVPRQLRARPVRKGPLGLRPRSESEAAERRWPLRAFARLAIG